MSRKYRIEPTVNATARERHAGCGPRHSLHEVPLRCDHEFENEKLSFRFRMIMRSIPNSIKMI